MAENDTVTVEVTIRVEDLTEEQLYAARVLAERIAASAYNQVAAEHVAVIEAEKGNQIDPTVSTAEAAGILTAQREEDAVPTDPIVVSAPTVEEVAGEVITLPSPVTEPAVVENVEPTGSTAVEDEPVDEAPAEEVHEDEPVTEPAPEPVVNDAPAEEPVAEEAPVEEPVEEPVEDPIEDPAAEETKTEDVVAAAETAPEVDVVEAPAVVTDEEHKDA